MRTSITSAKSTLCAATTVVGLLFPALAFAQNALPPAKQAIEQLYAQEREEGAKNPAPKNPDAAYPIADDLPFDTGIINSGDAPFPSQNITIVNRWQGILNGVETIVYAGGESEDFDPQQGLVIVMTLADYPEEISTQTVLTPIKVGAVQIVAAQNGLLTLASVTGSSKFTFDLSNGTFTSSQLSADLSITQSASPSPAVAGTTITYTITVHNAGPSDAPNVVVIDTLPAGASSASGPCTGTAVLTCNLGTLSSGSGKDFAIQLKIPANFLSNSNETTGQIVNKVSVASSISDPNFANNTSSLTTTLSSAAYLTLTMTGTPDPVHEGTIVTYSMSFTNAGPSDAIQGYILDYLLPGFAFVNSSVLPCGGGVGVGLCDLGPVVPAGFTLNFPVQVSVPANFLASGTTSNTVINTAMIFSDTLDPHPGNNPVSSITTVIH